MTDFYNFAGNHPVLTFFIAWFMMWFVTEITQQVFTFISRMGDILVRLIHGWPEVERNRTSELLNESDYE